MTAAYKQRDVAIPSSQARPWLLGIQLDAGEVLDHLAQGVIVTDAKAMPVIVNRAARDIVAEADGLRLDPAGLGAERPQESAAMRWMIAAAAAARSADVLPQTMSISRPSMRRPLTLLIASRRAAQAGLREAADGSIVFVTDPERTSAVPSRLLQSAYGLTPMEAAVAIEITRGDGLQSVAEKLGIGASTARTHLQHAFEKTGTRRQAQLAWLIAGSCGSLHLSHTSN